jgi:predicted TIM-barrel fold metal-dependent hydrolase
MTKIIDMHTHIGFNNIISSSPAELVESMIKAGIEKSLVFAGHINNCSTTQLLEAIKPYKDKLYGIGSISPNKECQPQPLEIESLLKENRIHGLKFYTGYEHFYPADTIIRPYLELLAKYNRPAIFHSGDCYYKCRGALLKYAHPLQFDDLATELPELKIVIAHMGWSHIRDTAQVLYKNHNVYVDCSGLAYKQLTCRDKKNLTNDLMNFMSIFDSDESALERILFGTDWPICDQQSYVQSMKECISLAIRRNQLINDTEMTEILDNIFHKTTTKLFGLED